ncbi:MAG TPA: hypothetical protein VJR89_37250, partial [Polyangiales bacterium]|nr:hypothetical protein [Polyangiales bacterium]
MWRRKRRAVCNTSTAMSRFVPLAAAALLLIAGYLSYARARVSDAIQSVAEREGLQVAFETTGSWRPGSVGLRELRVYSPSLAGLFELSSLDLDLEPVLGGPRRVQITLRAERARMRLP